ncbi:MAG TPA: hypothetical protein VNA04_13055 [Thermoanaerobaculia bacterium]|nr:hypothetical protein [Thermoanaerobaculia bacterium]
MRISRQLASRIAVVMAVATMGSASAFAESRPSKETRERRAESNIQRRGSNAEARRGNASVNRSGRQQERRVNRDRGRQSDRSGNRGPRETYRAPAPQNRRGPAVQGRPPAAQGRGPSVQNRRAPARSGQVHRQPYRAHGRVSRVARHGGGYRVWIAGAPYPFYIPAAHYHRDRFRVGLLISLGGLYNPRGYYDYYDARYSRGTLRGYVESVDYRRDTFVLRNEATGSFVTVLMRDRRRDVRPGDYVELYGDWSRSGLFQAYDVDLLPDRYRRY